MYRREMEASSSTCAQPFNTHTTIHQSNESIAACVNPNLFHASQMQWRRKKKWRIRILCFVSWRIQEQYRWLKSTRCIIHNKHKLRYFNKYNYVFEDEKNKNKIKIILRNAMQTENRTKQTHMQQCRWQRHQINVLIQMIDTLVKIHV